MHYRTEVALLAVGACSGDRAVRPPAKTVVHSTVWWLDKAGVRHEMQLPDQAMNQLFLKGHPAVAVRGLERAAPVTSTRQVTDSAGHVWSVTVTAVPGEPQTSTTVASADTALYSEQMTWAVTDTGWGLSQINISVNTPTVTGGGSVQPIPNQTMIRSRLAPLLAMGRRCTEGAAAFLLPDKAEAQLWCYVGGFLALIFADLNYARALAGALVTFNFFDLFNAAGAILIAEAWIFSCAAK